MFGHDDIAERLVVVDVHFRCLGECDCGRPRLPDGNSQIFRLYAFGHSDLKDYVSAMIHCKILPSGNLAADDIGGGGVGLNFAGCAAGDEESGLVENEMRSPVDDPVVRETVA